MGADVNRGLQGAWLLMTYCAGRGCLEAVKVCLAAGAEVDAQGEGFPISWHDWFWWTAVVVAAYRGHEAVVEALLEAGASAKVGPGGEDHTLATVCKGSPMPGTVRRLAEAGADVNGPYRSMTAPALCQAANRGDVAMMGLLVELGAEVDPSDRRSAIWFAANGEVVRWLAAGGASMQDDGALLYETLVEYGCLDAFRALVELGADVNQPEGLGAMVPLHHVVQVEEEQEAVELVHLLLAAGADIRAEDVDGNEVLHFVKHAACVDVLVDAGADVEACGFDGMTPLHCAVQLGEEQAAVEVTRALLTAGADVNAGDCQEHTALHHAKYVACVDLLLGAGADLEARGVGGQTPLHAAAETADEAAEVTRRLLAEGADVNALDRDGCTPLHFATSAACVDLLVDAEAELEARDRQGRTPIYAVATDASGNAEALVRLADCGADLVNTGGEPGLVQRRVQELRAQCSQGQLQ